MPVNVALQQISPAGREYVAVVNVLYPPRTKWLSADPQPYPSAVSVNWNKADFEYVTRSANHTPDRVGLGHDPNDFQLYWSSTRASEIRFRVRCLRLHKGLGLVAQRDAAGTHLPSPNAADKDEDACKCGTSLTYKPCAGCVPATAALAGNRTGMHARTWTGKESGKSALGVALIGQKFMGRAHSNAWGQVGRFFELPVAVRQLVVAGRNGKELDGFARRWGWEYSTTRWQNAVEASGVQLVDIGTPNQMHREQALAALAAGKHVACEKPLAGTLDDARSMRDAARKAKRKGIQTFVWFNYRRCPAVGLAYKLLRAGRLGAIRHVRARYLQSWGGPQTPMSWRFDKQLAGSGAHGDLNAHIVDLARFLVGEEIVEVHGALARTFLTQRPVAAGSRRMATSDVDDVVAFLASFASGATASFEASRLAGGHLNDNGIEINGELGSLAFSFERMNELEYFDGRAPKSTAGWTRIMCTSAGDHPYAANWWPEAHVLGYEHGFVNQAADIVRQLQGKPTELPLPDFEDAWQTQRVLEAALLSAKHKHGLRLAKVR